ncbi:hypothetical protein UNDYM_5462 [Undibacterium sp. YM2]|nr:hypothetical protein UNDYM_5462 [Undibacterium sp. YM2]
MQAHAVTQADSILSETPATPQTAALLFPFSVLHNRRLHMGTAKVKNNIDVKNNINVKTNDTTT